VVEEAVMVRVSLQGSGCRADVIELSSQGCCCRAFVAELSSQSGRCRAWLSTRSGSMSHGPDIGESVSPPGPEPDKPRDPASQETRQAKRPLDRELENLAVAASGGRESSLMGNANRA